MHSFQAVQQGSKKFLLGSRCTFSNKYAVQNRTRSNSILMTRKGGRKRITQQTRSMASNLTLEIDLRGKKAFIAGVADDNGFGWAIAKALSQAGAEVILGTWVPALNIFETSYRRGKFDESRKLSDGSLMEFAKIYPMDAVFDTMDDVPEDIRTNKRYAGNEKWTVSEVAESVAKDFGKIDILVHSLANGREVAKPLLETSRDGYLGAISASSYSNIAMLQKVWAFNEQRRRGDFFDVFSVRTHNPRLRWRHVLGESRP